ncbi:hypothetical protein BN961_02694 [Afipia felis]|uniref:Uncharacterized protein n=1 Tax=Afipia felis TaxID=1035 RepID=A0A090MU90_AFIFE|nr:hypothetical protein BN961_02694 [Afipia felis]
MPSATTADSSDSIEPSSAKAMASGSTACIFCSENTGRLGAGIDSGIPPKREPMVSTDNPRSDAASVAITTPIRIPGQLGRRVRNTTITTMVPPASTTADGLIVPITPLSAASLGRNAAGS